MSPKAVDNVPVLVIILRSYHGAPYGATVAGLAPSGTGGPRGVNTFKTVDSLSLGGFCYYTATAGFLGPGVNAPRGVCPTIDMVVSIRGRAWLCSYSCKRETDNTRLLFVIHGRKYPYLV